MSYISMIAAVSQNGIIGKSGSNSLPWDFSKYPQDMKFFRASTANSTVIMGRKTFESIGSKPLPKRRNIIVTRSKIDNLECYTTVAEAVQKATIETLEASADKPINKVFLIGGESIYREGMEFADEILLTLIPEKVEGSDLVAFPWIDPSKFQVAEYINLPECDLKVARYVKTK